MFSRLEFSHSPFLLRVLVHWHSPRSRLVPPLALCSGRLWAVYLPNSLRASIPAAFRSSITYHYSSSKSWRSSFYLLSGFTMLCFFGGLVSFDKDIPSQEADKRIDWLGAFLITAGLVFIVFVLGDGEIAPKKWRTPCKLIFYCTASFLGRALVDICHTDIIAFIILGVMLIGAFIYWQDYLEKVQADPGAPYSKLTPPPLMKPSLWKRADGKFAAMMAVAFTTWCSFTSWTFWVQVRHCFPNVSFDVLADTAALGSCIIKTTSITPRCSWLYAYFRCSCLVWHVTSSWVSWLLAYPLFI